MVLPMLDSDFAVFILTYGRPDKVITIDNLRSAGYTGPIYLVCSDDDATLPEYQRRFGDKVLVFSKEEICKTMDSGTNDPRRNVVVYARNVCHSLAERIGIRYFVQLDDDYTGFRFTFDRNFNFNRSKIRDLDSVFDAFVEYLASVPSMLTIAFAQGGDFIGGDTGDIKRRPKLTRKAMNSFICATDRPFQFVGKINEDVNTYAMGSRRGELFLTAIHVQLDQLQTQSNSGGLTEFYLELGTYVKSFYSVMYCPSAVKVGLMGDHRANNYRLHHQLNWHRLAPKIVSQNHRKAALP